MPTNVVEAFDVALSGLLKEGVDNRCRRLAAARDRVRDGLEEMGFRMLSPIDIAAVVTYERNAWSNHVGDAVQPAQVASAKK